MYEEYYKLKAKPFHLSPDPRFFFGSSGHKRVLAYLRYGINQGEGFIVVTGEVGTGKTTLLRTLLSELPSDNNIIAAQLVTTQLECDELLRMVAASFGLAYEGRSKSTLLRELESFFMANAREGRRALLIVDEAQNLPAHSLEELRMLSNYQVGSKSLFQSFLVGQVEFRNTLRAPNLEQLRQRVIASYHLGPMDLNETKAYIEHRLNLVGWGGDPAFTQEAYMAVYDYARGVPRKINTLCDRILLVGYLDELHEITDETVGRVIDELREETEDSSTPATEMAEAESGAAVVETGATERIAALESRVEALEGALRNTWRSLESIFSNVH